MRQRGAALAAALQRAADGFVVALFLVLFAILLSQIVFRYVLDEPLIWSDELSRYLFVWVAMLGWTLAARRRSHIAIRAFVDAMPVPARRAFDALGHGTALTARNVGLPTVTLFFDFAVVYAIVPACAIAVAASSVAGMLAALRGTAP
jgi:TRAP-type C4-dicarboxylate transport system permease small subunit